MFLVPVVCKCHFQNTCKQTITHSIVLEQRSTTPPHCFTMHGRWVRRAPLFQHAARSTAWAQPSNSLCYICLLICIKTVSHRPIERKPLYCFSNQPYSTATMKIYKLGTVGDRSAVVKKINGEYVVSIRVMNGEFDKFVLLPPKRQVLHITFIIHRSVLKYKNFIMRMLHTFVISKITTPPPGGKIHQLNENIHTLFTKPLFYVLQMAIAVSMHRRRQRDCQDHARRWRRQVTATHWRGSLRQRYAWLSMCGHTLVLPATRHRNQTH